LLDDAGLRGGNQQAAKKENPLERIYVNEALFQ
jgi:hypothetical protein